MPVAVPPPAAPDDVPVDVTVSYAKGAGRFKLHFRSSKPLVETLVAWTRAGHDDIRLTWGSTATDAREQVTHTLAREAVKYTVPATADAEPPTRASLLLGALGVVAVFAVGIALLVNRANDAGEGLNKALEEQREREEQNRRGVERALEQAQTRVFRELDDADPTVRLQAVLQVAQVYASDPRAVPGLVKRAKDTDRRVRLAAIAALGHARTNIEEVKGALQECVSDPDEQVRKVAGDALNKLK